MKIMVYEVRPDEMAELKAQSQRLGVEIETTSAVPTLENATLAAGCCFVGFLVAGFTANALLTLAVAVALLMLSLLFLHRRTMKKERAEAEAAGR